MAWQNLQSKRVTDRDQCALLFDRSVSALDAIVRDFARIEEMKTDTIFNVPEHNAEQFARLENADEKLSLSFEYINQPPSKDIFRKVLSSRVTSKLCPDIDARLARCASHIVLEAWHDDDKALTHSQTHNHQPGQNHFVRRLELLALMGRITYEHAIPCAVYWTQSNRLLCADMFEELASAPVPNALHIHPVLFGQKRQALDAEPDCMGVRSFGAARWLGYEIEIAPGHQDWKKSYAAILAVIAAHTAQDKAPYKPGAAINLPGQEQSYRFEREANSAEDGPRTDFAKLIPIGAAGPCVGGSESGGGDQPSHNGQGSGTASVTTSGRRGQEPGPSRIPARPRVFGRKRV